MSYFRQPNGRMEPTFQLHPGKSLISSINMDRPIARGMRILTETSLLPSVKAYRKYDKKIGEKKFKEWGERYVPRISPSIILMYNTDSFVHQPNI